MIIVSISYNNLKFKGNIQSVSSIYLSQYELIRSFNDPTVKKYLEKCLVSFLNLT